ncbi:interleukin-17F-like [Leptodactylus fuscus]|uniref:interleukin-17F-like n=1 Tax=Leptodactylus fuscus TaxID=238119 RepID=UPI003F4EFCD8
MRQLRNRLLWQVVIAIVALMLLTHPVDGAKKRKNNNKCSEKKKCAKCIEVQVVKPIIIQGKESGIRNFVNRSIVPFTYKSIENPGGYPQWIFEMSCLDTCMFKDMNAVPIKRNILYLKREGNVFVLSEMMVTVGCTCVTAEVIEQPSR